MYDVIIVGAGPAGTTAALFAKKNNLNCILLDKAIFPRDKVCGDALSGKSVRIMNELDLTEEVEQLHGSEINRITFGGPNHSQFDVHLKGNNKNNYITKGYVIPRKIFDHFLFKKAKNVTEVLEGFKVNDLIYENNRPVGIKGINKDGKRQTLKAPVILGCDGTNSIIARKLEVYKRNMDHTAVAIRCYYEGVKGLSNQIELHYIKEVKPGYFWLFPAGGDKANIGIGLSKNDAKKEDRTLSKIMEEVTQSEYFRNRFASAKPLEKPKGWNLPMGSIHRKNHGDGYMLLGDAAGLIDPFTGEGIGNAMVAAKYAIQAAKKAKEKGDYSQSTLKVYDELLWNEIGKELRTSTKLQSLSRSSFLLNFVINRASRNQEVQDIISGMLSKEIPKDELSSPLFYFKILFS